MMKGLHLRLWGMGEIGVIPDEFLVQGEEAVTSVGNCFGLDEVICPIAALPVGGGGVQGGGFIFKDYIGGMDQGFDGLMHFMTGPLIPSTQHPDAFCEDDIGNEKGGVCLDQGVDCRCLPGVVLGDEADQDIGVERNGFHSRLPCRRVRFVPSVFDGVLHLLQAERLLALSGKMSPQLRHGLVFGANGDGSVLFLKNDPVPWSKSKPLHDCLGDSDLVFRRNL